MWVVSLLLLLLLPLPLSVYAEDLGELSANPARLSGLFGFFGLSGFFGSPGEFAGPANKTNEPRVAPVPLVALFSPSASQTALRPSPPSQYWARQLRTQNSQLRTSPTGRDDFSS
jgi:hypothetical protein